MFKIICGKSKIDRAKMIGIKPASRRSGTRRLTATFTTAGMELQITGQSAQRISVHTDHPSRIYEQLKNAKSLDYFAFSARERKPGV
jgi:lipid A disaccharide synthetase